MTSTFRLLLRLLKVCLVKICVIANRISKTSSGLTFRCCRHKTLRSPCSLYAFLFAYRFPLLLFTLLFSCRVHCSTLVMWSRSRRSVEFSGPFERGWHGTSSLLMCKHCERRVDLVIHLGAPAVPMRDRHLAPKWTIYAKKGTCSRPSWARFTNLILIQVHSKNLWKTELLNQPPTPVCRRPGS